MTLASLHRLGTADEVYNYAAENRPHIKAERLRLESSENSVLIAKSALYPSILAFRRLRHGGVQRRQR